uniref:Laminin subunit beta-1 n=1 Tax=Meloidogyne hapla TaxID=6305 RepID=A0A1I8B0Z9_MELHA
MKSNFIFYLILILLLKNTSCFEEEADLCTDRSCLPATGNLLIGRKHHLSATSTCGIQKPGRYCIVSHLEHDEKCFVCDSRQPWSPGKPGILSHRIENVVKENYEDRTRNWWQSENGVQNVSIRLDLEAEFHFTHLIMVFRSFRPAAMLIERSKDFGKNWTTYRYFAYDCASSFPHVKESPPRNHNDVICTKKYSDVAPSTGGELVYKVISPHIRTEDPYAPDIAELLKITNLRITFIKLHSLGDNLLDYRPEIDEKYWYAVYELVVRGSCSCYGHAQRCVPVGDETVLTAKLPDMVHGKCECTHNTKGMNCDDCEDFYNDSPWRPGIGDQSNECKRCECNDHATRCHFDWAVYNASGFASGGVCDDCQHNTMGKNCEQCKPYFYRDPQRSIRDPYVCRPCQCDRNGSKYDGICEGEEDPQRGLVAGKCYCKSNVDGPNCDRCKNGFWEMRGEDPDGCRPCSCNLIGTYGNEGCDKVTGKCTCKALVMGEQCDHCLQEHYELTNKYFFESFFNLFKYISVISRIWNFKHFYSDCDPGGAYDNHCDSAEGMCRCRPNYSGRRCNTTESGYFCPFIDKYTFEAEYSILPSNAEQVPREYSVDRPWTWTGEGFVRVYENTNLSFFVEGLQKTGHYNFVIRYELLDPNDPIGWEDVRLTIVRPGDPSPDGVCANIIPSDDFLIARLPSRSKFTEVMPAVCLEAGVRYEIRLHFGEKRSGYPDRQAQALIDSLVIAPQTDTLELFRGSETNEYRKQIYDRFQCRALSLSGTPASQMPLQCLDLVCPMNGPIVGEAVSCDCDLTGSTSGICNAKGGQCECKPNVVGRRCDRCAAGTFGFGPSGCSPCDCDSVGALSNACDKQSGQCVCRERGITGRQCNQCQPGFWNFPECRTCQCNGHASICDQRTGACIDCRNLTDGAHCERCVDGYYGDPRLGVGIPCKACPCPGGPGSGYQHADTCYIAPQNQTVVCNCRHGYIGQYCDQCEVNFWGNPREIGGSCEKCHCHDNIDFNVPNSCDPMTGDCLKCLHNTGGDQCQHCLDGFFGDARIRTCVRCVCNNLGTNSSAGACDRVTGQCPCFPNVIGVQCDQCAPLHYDLASGKGCSACNCDTNGVIFDPNTQESFLKCNDIDGQCHCKPGRGGRTCSDCQDLYWGDPVHGECQQCECDPYGSTTLQCHRQNGTCICKPGSGGPKCNECARGYTGQWPHCQACGECFDNWDSILQGLRFDLEKLVERALNIEDTGISSEYDESFIQMEKQVEEEDLDLLRQQMQTLQTQIDSTRDLLSAKNQRVTKISTEVNLAEQDIRVLNESTRQISQLADNLKDRSEGASEILEESSRSSADSERRIGQQLEIISQSETDRLKAEQLLNEHKRDFDWQYDENKAKLFEISQTITTIGNILPSINYEVCGAESAPCDAICGGPGPGCQQCGGTSCGGSVSKAAMAQEFAHEALDKVNAKRKDAEEILKNIREILPKTEEARKMSDNALHKAKNEKEKINKIKDELLQKINATKMFLEENKHRPEDIHEKINEILKTTIPFNEDQIRELSENIRVKVAEATDTEQILKETSNNKTTALNLQKKSENIQKRSEIIKNITLNIKEMIENANEKQIEAEKLLNYINSSLENAKSKITTTEADFITTEQRSKDSLEKLQKLQNITDHLKAEYIKITSKTKSASISSNNANKIVKEIEDKHNELKEKYTKIIKLLEEKENGNEERNKKALSLRKKTTDLLFKIKKSREEKKLIIQRADALEIEILQNRQTIDKLNAELQTIAADIEKRVEFHSTCDT